MESLLYKTNFGASLLVSGFNQFGIFNTIRRGFQWATSSDGAPKAEQNTWNQAQVPHCLDEGTGHPQLGSCDDLIKSCVGRAHGKC